MSTATRDQLWSEAELLAGDLAQHRVDALAHLRPRMEERDGAVGLGAEDGVAELAHAVADARVLEAAGDAGEPRVAIRVADGEQRLFEADAGAELLAGAEAVADVECVAPADLPAVDRRPLRRARSSTPSMAKFVWLTPKPRIAPHGGLFV